MKRVNKIIQHELYQKEFVLLQEAEKDRIFCNHTMEHFLDVARLMYIYNLENETKLPQEILYAAALLHDIGRNEQYRIGTPHDEAGARLAQIILADCDFAENEIRMIRHAIGKHRSDQTDSAEEKSLNKSYPEEAHCEEAHSNEAREMERLLAEYLYKADKKSRNCFACRAFDECKWSAEKKNMKIDR